MIYLDNNASMPPTRSHLEEVIKLLSGEAFIGNPSSTHSAGRSTKRLLETSRLALKNAFGCRSANIIFTSGNFE